MIQLEQYRDPEFYQVIYEACRYERVEGTGYKRTVKWRPVEVSHADQSTRIEGDNSMFNFRKKNRNHKRGGSPDHDDEYMDHLFDKYGNDENDRGSSVDSDGTVVDKIQFKASRRAWKKIHHGSDGRFNPSPSIDDSHLTITEGEDIVIKKAPRLSESQNLGSKKSARQDGQAVYSTPKNSGALELSAPLVSKKSIAVPGTALNRRVSLSNQKEVPASNHEIEKVVLNSQTGKKKYLLRPSIEKPSPRLLGNLQINRTTQRSKTNEPSELRRMKSVQTPKTVNEPSLKSPAGIRSPFREPEILENLPRVRR